MTDTPTANANNRADLVLVTGMSGAGRSTALAVLEDLGFDAVDNLPLSLLPRLAQSIRENPSASPVAIGVDIRNRDFGIASLQAEIDTLKMADGLKVTTLFLDCSDDELLRRFTETRRRHPWLRIARSLTAFAWNGRRSCPWRPMPI